MKNLFRRIYLKHDSHLSAHSNQERFIITSRVLTHPFPADATMRKQMGILDVVKSLEELDARYGDREGFWRYLRAYDGRVAIIAGRLEAAELLIQYWKSILKSSSLEVVYKLYQFFISSENLQALSGSQQIMVDANLLPDQGVTTQGATLEEFTEIYNRTSAVTVLTELQLRDIPIEYLLAGYFAAPSQVSVAKTNLGRIAFDKVYQIVLANVIAQLTSARQDYFINTHNFYRLDDSDPGATIDPMQFITTHPNLVWVLDNEFRADNLERVLEKYTLVEIQEFFSAYKKLFSYDLESAFALDYIAKNDIAGLLAYDVEDEVGNFFGTENYAFKVNGLFVSHLYQLYRQDKKDQLALYALR